MEDILNKLRFELGLDYGDEVDLYGERNNQPLILSFLSADPPSIIFKIRLNTEDERNLEVPQFAEYDDIKTSIEIGYGWLTIYNIYDYSYEEIIAILDTFLEALAENQLSLDEKCGICRNNESAEICYSDSKINKICNQCKDSLELKLVDKDRKLSQRKYIYSILVPVGILTFGVGWLIYWLLYDWSFTLVKTDTVQTSDYFLVVTSIVAGVIISLPAGFILKKLYMRNNILLTVISILIVSIGCIIGDTFHNMIFIFKRYGVLTFRASFQLVPYFWKDLAPALFIIKATLIVTSIITIILIAKGKKPTVDL